MRLADVAAAIATTITNDAVRKRSQTGKPACSRTTLKPEVVADPTFSKLQAAEASADEPTVIQKAGSAIPSSFEKVEVIAEPAFWMTVGSSALASAASRPSHSWVGAETTC